MPAVRILLLNSFLDVFGHVLEVFKFLIPMELCNVIDFSLTVCFATDVDNFVVLLRIHVFHCDNRNDDIEVLFLALGNTTSLRLLLLLDGGRHYLFECLFSGVLGFWGTA